MDIFQISADLGRQPARSSAGRQNQLVVGNVPVLVRGDPFRRAIDIECLGFEMQSDPLLLIHVLGTQKQTISCHFALQILLRQRRALVRRHRLF